MKVISRIEQLENITHSNFEADQKSNSKTAIKKNSELTMTRLAEIYKDLEVLLPNYNNDKKLFQIFYYSRLFVRIITLLKNEVTDKNYKLLLFIEKLFKNNKNISRFVSRNYNFINLIVSLMKNKVILLFIEGLF